MSILTIAIPCYNCNSNILKILKNILSLPPKFITILISDNCSTDNSLQIIKKFKLSNPEFHIKIYKQDFNIGAGKNFEFLLKKATTKYFLWIGSDDIVKNLDVSLFDIFNLNKDIIGLSFNSFFIDKKQEHKIYDKGNFKIISKLKIIRLAKYLYRPGVNSKFYSIFKTEVLKKSFCYNYCGKFAWDIIVVFNTLKYGSIEYTNKVKLVRQFGISSDPIKLRKSLFKNKINIFFPNLSPFFLILKDLKFFEKFVLFPFLFKYYLRLLISPVHHFIKK